MGGSAGDGRRRTNGALEMVRGGGGEPLFFTLRSCTSPIASSAGPGDDVADDIGGSLCGFATLSRPGGRNKVPDDGEGFKMEESVGEETGGGLGL